MLGGNGSCTALGTVHYDSHSAQEGGECQGSGGWAERLVQMFEGVDREQTKVILALTDNNIEEAIEVLEENGAKLKRHDATLRLDSQALTSTYSTGSGTPHVDAEPASTLGAIEAMAVCRSDASSLPETVSGAQYPPRSRKAVALAAGTIAGAVDTEHVLKAQRRSPDDDTAQHRRFNQTLEDEGPVTRIAETADTGADTNTIMNTAAVDSSVHNLRDCTGQIVQPKEQPKKRAPCPSSRPANPSTRRSRAAAAACGENDLERMHTDDETVTLHEEFARAAVPAQGRWQSSGSAFVGDRIPTGVWPCRQPQVIKLSLEGDVDLDGREPDDGELWTQIRQQKALERSDPVIIHSKRIQDRHAVSSVDSSTDTVTDVDNSWVQRFVGRGRKLFVMFPPEDREKLLVSDRGSEYIDPIDPPADPNHTCYQARCFFADIRAGGAKTLVLPAGWLHFVLTIEDTAMICIELTVESRLLASLKTLKTIHALEQDRWNSPQEFYCRWQEKGFCLASVLKEFVENCHKSKGIERKRRAQDAKYICIILEQEGVAKSLSGAVSSLFSWLRCFSAEGRIPSLSSLPTIGDRRSRLRAQWEDTAEETLYLYNKALDTTPTGEQSDNRGKLIADGCLSGADCDLRTRAKEFMVDPNEKDPRIAFFEGFCHRQLATAIDAERCGGIHGETSLLLSEAGAKTHTHFDTGPYSAITFHLIANTDHQPTVLTRQSKVSPRVMENTGTPSDTQNYAFYEFVVITESCVLVEIGPDWSIRRRCPLYQADDPCKLASTGAAVKHDTNEIFIVQNQNYECLESSAGRIVVVDELTFKLDNVHQIDGELEAEGLAISGDSLYVAGYLHSTHGVFEFDVSARGCVLVRQFSTGDLNPWGVVYCSVRNGIFVTVDNQIFNEDQLRSDAQIAQRAANRGLAASSRKTKKRKITQASGQVWFQKFGPNGELIEGWVPQSLQTDQSKQFARTYMWRPGGLACDSSSSTIFATTYGDSVIAVDTTAHEQHSVIIQEHLNHRLPSPNDVVLVGDQHLLVTAGDRTGDRGTIEVFRRTAARDNFQHVLTIAGEDFSNDNWGIPNYIAGPFKLRVMETNVEVACQFDHSFTYVTASQFMLTNAPCSAPQIPVRHRLRIYDTGDVRGKGVRYVGAKVIPSNSLICCYAGELLTPAQSKYRETANASATGMGYMFDLKQFDHEMVQNRCGRCTKATTDGVDIVCEVCERCFHPACQGIADPLAYESWCCRDCVGFLSAQQNGNHEKMQQFEEHAREHLVSTIDATRKGNCGRFFNHSCDPCVFVEEDSETLTLLMKAKRDILSGEELTIDYKPGAQPGDQRAGAPECVCGSNICRGWCPV